MKLRLLLVIAAVAASCEQSRPRTFGGPRTIVDAGVFTDAGGPGDAGDASVVDAGLVDAGARDAGQFHDAGFRDAGFRDGGVVARDGGPPAGDVALMFTGCAPDFDGELVVSYNGSIAIGSLDNQVLTSSLQFDLDGPGTKVLSTRHRIDTGEVVNLVVGTTWTNISTDSEVILGNAPDPIGGTLVVREYVPSAGRFDVDFINVTLAHTQTGAVCRINGNVVATRLGR